MTKYKVLYFYKRGILACQNQTITTNTQEDDL